MLLNRAAASDDGSDRLASLSSSGCFVPRPGRNDTITARRGGSTAVITIGLSAVSLQPTPEIGSYQMAWRRQLR